MFDFYKNETKTTGFLIPTSPYNKDIKIGPFPSMYIALKSYNSPYMNGVMSHVRGVMMLSFIYVKDRGLVMSL